MSRKIIKTGKKWRLGIFIFLRHSEAHFELENSEFSCEINF